MSPIAMAMCSWKNLPGRVKELRPEPDVEQGSHDELSHLAAEDRQDECDGLHLEDAGGELEELERERRWAHRGDHHRQELLVLEAIPHPLVALAVDAFEQEELAARAADKERHEGTDGRGC